MTDVGIACCEFLKSQLHPTNCLGIRAFADMHSCRDLLQAAHSFIEQHFTEVVTCEEFLQLPSESIIEFISSDKLTVQSEDKVSLFYMHTRRLQEQKTVFVIKGSHHLTVKALLCEKAFYGYSFIKPMFELWNSLPSPSFSEDCHISSLPEYYINLCLKSSLSPLTDFFHVYTVTPCALIGLCYLLCNYSDKKIVPIFGLLNQRSLCQTVIQS